MTRDRWLSPQPDWPPMNSRSAPASPPRATLPRRSTPPPPADTGEWWPYPMFGGITLLLGALALLVVAL